MIAQKIAPISLAGTASGCMCWLGGTTPEGRADLPDVLAPAGAAWDWRSDAFLPSADRRDDGRMRALGWRPRAVLAIRFPPRWRPDACPGMAPAGVPGAGLSRHCMHCS
jgi:hypothetical protein